MNQVTVLRGSVVHADTDAIVNAANPDLWEGGGVCGAIFAAAGREELFAACANIGRCPTGCAVMTPGFHCKAKYIIHAVGPVYTGRDEDAYLLASAYRACLDRAEEFGLSSVGFCSISTGIYGYPLEEAAAIAMQTLRDYPANSVTDIRMYCFQEQEYQVYSCL